MKKTDRKTDNAIREALTEACESALDTVQGFKWLTHFANYDNFPDSLAIVCVFETDNDLASARDSKNDEYLGSLIIEKLASANINVKAIRQKVSMDSEESCRRENNGNWRERLRQ